jgi:hypothetical protein
MVCDIQARNGSQKFSTLISSLRQSADPSRAFGDEAPGIAINPTVRLIVVLDGSLLVARSNPPFELDLGVRITELNALQVDSHLQKLLS